MSGSGRLAGSTGLPSTLTDSWLRAPESLCPFVLIQQLFQYLPRARDGPGAVADDVLLMVRQLCHSRGVLQHPEDRVVSETSFTCRRLRDLSEHFAFSRPHSTRPRIGHRYHAAEARPPPLSRHAGEPTLDVGEALGVR